MMMMESGIVSVDREVGEDARLITLFLAGDAVAFEKLVERNVKFAGAIAYSVTGDFHAAKDVVQEAFLRVHSGLAKLQEVEKFRAWLRNVVRTTALDWRRRNKKGRGGSLDALEDSGQEPEAEAVEPLEAALERDELRRQVREEIGKLPESQREVVALKYLDDRSYEEISALTGLSVATIESRLWRARNTLRQRFERALEQTE
jgi:RNA polymerase sigma-70 factor (ECF subfamily)